MACKFLTQHLVLSTNRAEWCSDALNLQACLIREGNGWCPSRSQCLETYNKREALLTLEMCSQLGFLFNTRLVHLTAQWTVNVTYIFCSSGKSSYSRLLLTADRGDLVFSGSKRKGERLNLCRWSWQGWGGGGGHAYWFFNPCSIRRFHLLVVWL